MRYDNKWSEKESRSWSHVLRSREIQETIKQSVPRHQGTLRSQTDENSSDAGEILPFRVYSSVSIACRQQRERRNFFMLPEMQGNLILLSAHISLSRSRGNSRETPISPRVRAPKRVPRNLENFSINTYPLHVRFVLSGVRRLHGRERVEEESRLHKFRSVRTRRAWDVIFIE